MIDDYEGRRTEFLKNLANDIASPRKRRKEFEKWVAKNRKPPLTAIQKIENLKKAFAKNDIPGPWPSK